MKEPATLDVASDAGAGPVEAEESPRHPFLLALGERVRMLRSRRGMTRKAVAVAADVSERHLANLEYGTGNASILVLLQVAMILLRTYRWVFLLRPIAPQKINNDVVVPRGRVSYVPTAALVCRRAVLEPLQVLGMFLLTCIGWLIFRETDLLLVERRQHTLLDLGRAGAPRIGERAAFEEDRRHRVVAAAPEPVPDRNRLHRVLRAAVRTLEQVLVVLLGGFEVARRRLARAWTPARECDGWTGGTR